MDVGKQYTLIDSYQMYREASTAKKKMVKAKYFKVVDLYLKFLVDKLFEGHEIAMGAKLGSLYIGGRKPKVRLDANGKILGVAIGWGRTGKHWRKMAEERGMTLKEFIEKVPQEERPPIYCFNEHTNGYSYTLRWTKDEAILATKSFYSLRFARANKRRLNTEVNNGTEYVITSLK